LTDPFVKTSKTSRVETKQGPDCITQGLMAHTALSQRLIHSQEEEGRGGEEGKKNLLSYCSERRH